MNLNLNSLETPLLESNIKSQDLHRAVYKFLHLVKTKNIKDANFFGYLMDGLNDLCKAIQNCEISGYSQEEIYKVIAPVREIISQSYFCKRIQTWPRGYPGDFETIEYMCENKNKSKPDTFAYVMEDLALNIPIVQQHRNKIEHQARIIKEVVKHSDDAKLIGILGCGGCADLRSVQNDIASFDPVIVLNDMDKDALRLAQKTCDQIKKLHCLNDNVLKSLRTMRNFGEYDLILAGGLLDYFDLERSTKIINMALKLLKPNGKLFFTNIAKGNPYRILIEYLATWHLDEKSEDELLNICLECGLESSQIKIETEATDLTYLVTLSK